MLKTNAIEPGTRVEETVVPCRLCGGVVQYVGWEIGDRRYATTARTFSVARCKSCGCRVVMDGSNPVDPSAFYPHSYDAFRPGSLVKVATPWKRCLRSALWCIGVASDRLAWLSVFSKVSKRRVLDVGCGTGHLARTVKVELNAIVEGIEPDRKSAQVATEAGIPTQVSTVENYNAHQQYDLVTMIHVLEHLEYPAEALRALKPLIRVGGQLVVAVPNAKSIECRLLRARWDGWDTPRHVHVFTPRSLRQLLTACGFRPRGIRFERYTVFFRSLCGSNTSRPYRERYSPGRIQRIIDLTLGTILALSRASSAIQVVADLPEEQ